MRLLFLSLIIISTCSCAYLEDRRKDLTDMAHLHLTALSIGGGVHAGPFILAHFENDGIKGTPGGRMKLGLGGFVEEKEKGVYSGVVIPFRRMKGITRSDSIYNSWAPPLGAVGFDLGFIMGIGARVDVVEVLDFILGIFTIDILDDDKGFKKKPVYDPFRPAEYEGISPEEFEEILRRKGIDPKPEEDLIPRLPQPDR